MISEEQKVRMRDYVCARIEESGRYIIHTCDKENILLAERAEFFDEPKTVNILLLNTKRPLKQWRNVVEQCRAHGWHTGSIFYKDHRTFFTRLRVRGHSKREHLLSDYDTSQQDRMLDLRALERKVLGDQSHFPVEDRGFPELTYYQPRTLSVPESLCTYSIGTVTPDYSHLANNDPSRSFARVRNAANWGLADEKQRLTRGLGFHALSQGPLFVLFREVEVPKPMGPNWVYAED